MFFLYIIEGYMIYVQNLVYTSFKYLNILV